jgi:hypothetical protein
MLRQFPALMLIGLIGCAHPSITADLRAPNPNGCYAIVYERPDYKGAGHVLNGPLRLPTLERLSPTNQEGRVCHVVEKFRRVIIRRDDGDYAAFFTSFIS